MMKSTRVLLVAALVMIVGETQVQSNLSPPPGTVVRTLPATFHCLITENSNETVTTEWLINTLPLNHSMITEGLRPDFTISGDSQENITINAVSPTIPNETPISLIISCIRPSRRSRLFYANFTLIVPPPIVSSVRFRSNVTAAEGDTATLCVDITLLKDVSSPPFNVTVEVLPQSTAEASIDYKSGDIPTSLSILGRETQCFNISILMDSNTREDVEMIQIRLANTTSPNVIIDQANSLITITITDPCFGMYACPTEGTCYNQSQVCDSYPDCVGQGSGSAIGLLFSLDEQDCPAGCTSGDVDLVVGVTSAEGAVRVCIDNGYIPLSTLGLSVLEASLICQQLGFAQVGFPSSSIDQLLFQLVSPRPYLATISCPDSASSLSDCSIGNTTQGIQATVNCNKTRAACTDGKVRLVPRPNSPEVNEGRVEVCYRGVWGVVMDRDWSNRDAAVVCRELGFPPQGAMPLCGAVYTYNEPVAFVAESITCVGNESALADCPSPSPLGHPSSYPLATNHFLVAGVRCDDYRPDGCTDLEVRLTYRDATGHFGQFEVCQNGTWRRTCDSTFFPIDADTACNQLFGPSQEGQFSNQYTRTASVLSDTAQVFTDLLLCVPGQPSLRNCSGSNQSSSVCPPERQPTVRCQSAPVVYLAPELPKRTYVLEAGHRARIQCLAESRTIPRPSSTASIERSSRQSFKRFVKRSILDSVHTFLSGGVVSESDAGEYECTVRNTANEAKRERFNVEVLSGEGQPEVAFLQFSIVNSTRFSTIPGGIDFSDTLLPNIERFFFINQINERTPGVQRVNCKFIDRRPMDVERGLERIECEIMHFHRSDETEVTSAAAIARRLARQFTLIIPFLADAEVSEHPEVAFTSPSSTGVEGDVLTICLAVISGEIATPTNVTLTTIVRSSTSTSGDIPPRRPGEEGLYENLPLPVIEDKIAAFDIDYTTNAPYVPAGGRDINITVTFEPGRTQSCFNIIVVNDTLPETSVKSLTFSYSSSTPTVGRVNLTHQVFILDDDRNCETDVGPGSRLCVDIPARNVTCLDPALVCDYQVVNCPDMSDELNCPSPLENLANQTVTEETLSNVSAVVSSFAAISANSTLLQTSEFLTDITMVFGNIAGFVETSNLTINNTVVENMAVTINSLTQWQSASLMVSSTSMIVESFETVISVFAQQGNANITLTDITIIAELGTTEMFMATGRRESFNRGGVSATINLPPSLFNNVPADRPVIGVFFALYENSALLPANNTIMRGNETIADTAVGSYIVGATVGPGIDFVNLNPPVTISLGLLPFTNNVSTNLQTARCTSWDFTTQRWITDGCKTIRIGPTDFNCECTHLTNFAILIDICRRAQDCMSDRVADEVLSYITYIGMVVSCISLILTVLTLLLFKKLREKDNSKYHIQLSVALFCLLVVFVAGVEPGIHVYGGCIVVSILVHYFSLVSVMWMGAEALLLFQKLVIVFMRITKKFLIILSLVCWLVPLIPVLIPMIVDLADGTDSDTDLIITRNYNSTTNTLSGFCFHKHPGVFFGAFLVPILLVILFNLVIFIWVTVILVRHTKGQMERSKEGMKPKTALRLVISITSVTFLFGLTWLFAAFTFTIAGNNVLRNTFQALFTVFASFQGFFIFLFFCVLNKEARESWKETLSCGRYKSELLHPSQYKNTSSAGSGPTRSKLKTGTTVATSTYSSRTIPKSTFDSEASPLPEKRDLEETVHTEIPLSSTNRTDEFGGMSTFKDTPKIEVESKIDGGEDKSKIDGEEHKSKIDGEDDKKAQKWLEAEPLKKARVKRYSTKKVAKHHIEEYEVDFGEEESSEEEEKTEV